MEMSVFDQFVSTSYTFYVLNQGMVEGNTLGAGYPASGILKIRDTMNTGDSVETESSDATLHVRPDESFIAVVGGNMVGNAIIASKNGATQAYRIETQVEGYNFETGVLEFYKLTLKREDVATWQESDIPLS